MFPAFGTHKAAVNISIQILMWTLIFPALNRKAPFMPPSVIEISLVNPSGI